MTTKYGLLLHRMRYERKLSRDFVARQTGLSLATLYKVECNDCNPRVDTLEELCKCYGVSLSSFFLDIERGDGYSYSTAQYLSSNTPPV